MSINYVGDMVSYTPQFKTNKIKKLQLTVQKGMGCCNLYVPMRRHQQCRVKVQSN